MRDQGAADQRSDHSRVPWRRKYPPEVPIVGYSERCHCRPVTRGAARVVKDQGYSEYSTEAITSGVRDQWGTRGHSAPDRSERRARPPDRVAEVVEQRVCPVLEVVPEKP